MISATLKTQEGGAETLCAARRRHREIACRHYVLSFRRESRSPSSPLDL